MSLLAAARRLTSPGAVIKLEAAIRQRVDATLLAAAQSAELLLERAS